MATDANVSQLHFFLSISVSLAFRVTLHETQMYNVDETGLLALDPVGVGFVQYQIRKFRI